MLFYIIFIIKQFIFESFILWNQLVVDPKSMVNASLFIVAFVTSTADITVIYTFILIVLSLTPAPWFNFGSSVVAEILNCI